MPTGQSSERPPTAATCGPRHGTSELCLSTDRPRFSGDTSTSPMRYLLGPHPDPRCSPPAARYVVAGRPARSVDRDRQAREIRRHRHAARGRRSARPGAQLSPACRSSSSRTASRRRSTRSTTAAGRRRIKLDGPDKLRITRDDRQAGVPDLKTGPARIVVTASRPVLRGIAHASSRPRRTTCRSGSSGRRSRSSRRKHYINLGGSEMVVYRATPADVDVGRAGRRPRVSRLPGDRRRRSKA